MEWRQVIKEKLEDAALTLGRYAKVEVSIASIEKTMWQYTDHIQHLTSRKEAVLQTNRKKIDAFNQELSFLYSRMFSLGQEQTHNARTGSFPDPESCQEGAGSDPDLSATAVGLASGDVADAAAQQCVGSNSSLSATAVGSASTNGADAVRQERVGGAPRLSATAVGLGGSVHGLSVAAGGSANSGVVVSVHSVRGAGGAKVDSSVDGHTAAARRGKPRKRQNSSLDVKQMLESEAWKEIGDEDKRRALNLCTKDQLRSLVERVEGKRAQRAGKKKLLVTSLMSILEAKHVPLLISTLGVKRLSAKRPAANQDEGASSLLSPASAKRPAADQLRNLKCWLYEEDVALSLLGA